LKQLGDFGRSLHAGAVTNRRLGFDTTVTTIACEPSFCRSKRENAAKRCIGDSLRDVQQLAGDSSLATTQRYIEGSSDAKRRIVDPISSSLKAEHETAEELVDVLAAIHHNRASPRGCRLFWEWNRVSVSAPAWHNETLTDSLVR